MVCGELFIPFEGPKYKLFIFYIKLTGQQCTILKNIIKKYHQNQLDPIMTNSCTASSCLQVVPHFVPQNHADQILIVYKNDDALFLELKALFLQGYKFSDTDIKITQSIHQHRIRMAKEYLINNILGKNPTPFEIQEVVSQSGIALNLQIDKDIVLEKKYKGNDINEKLKALGIIEDDNQLAEKYKSLNQFYNATKHSKISNRLKESVMNGKDGKYLAIDFFETIIRILKWYYKKYTGIVPSWSEFDAIQYSEFQESYIFDYNKKWNNVDNN